MGFEILTRSFEIEVRQWRIVRTWSRYQYVIHRRQIFEELLKDLEIGGIEGRGANGIEFGCSALKTLWIPTREDDVSPFGFCSSGRLKADTGASADQDNSLPKKFRLAAHSKSAGAVLMFPPMRCPTFPRLQLIRVLFEVEIA